MRTIKIYLNPFIEFMYKDSDDLPSIIEMRKFARNGLLPIKDRIKYLSDIPVSYIERELIHNDDEFEDLFCLWSGLTILIIDPKKIIQQNIKVKFI